MSSPISPSPRTSLSTTSRPAGASSTSPSGCDAPSAALADFGLDVDPTRPMSSLDLATQQLVVIARALAKQARLLILDEPTAALTENEVAASVRADADRSRRAASPSSSSRTASPRSSRFPTASSSCAMAASAALHAVTDVSRQQIVAEMIGELDRAVRELA